MADRGAPSQRIERLVRENLRHEAKLFVKVELPVLAEYHPGAFLPAMLLRIQAVINQARQFPLPVSVGVIEICPEHTAFVCVMI